MSLDELVARELRRQEERVFDDLLFRERQSFAVRDPHAQAKIVADFEPAMPEIVENDFIPDGDVAYQFAASEWTPAMILLPKFNRYGERHPQRFYGVPVPEPLWTRHMLGVQEGARDRRRRRRRTN